MVAVNPFRTVVDLGTPVAIANAAPKNFVHCVCENGTYETNGTVIIIRRRTSLRRRRSATPLSIKF